MREREASDSPAAATTWWPAASRAAARTAPTRPAPTTPTRSPVSRDGCVISNLSFQSLYTPGKGQGGYRTSRLHLRG